MIRRAFLFVQGGQDPIDPADPTGTVSFETSSRRLGGLTEVVLVIVRT
jgi:hypothetical protein